MSKVGRRRKAEAGFTLVEMIIVVGIIAVLSAILSLGIRRAEASFALRGAASTVVAEIQRTREAAIAEGVVHAVEFVPTNPGRLVVHRPGLAAGGGTVTVRSSSSPDTRIVVVTGRRVNALVSEQLTLDGTEPVPSTKQFDWVLEAAVSLPGSSVTITASGGSATIASNATTAVLPWVVMLTRATPEWPRVVAVADGGTSFDQCPNPPGDATSKCLLFGPLGEPVRASGSPGPCATPPCKVRLTNTSGGALDVVVEPATGRVSVQRP